MLLRHNRKETVAYVENIYKRWGAEYVGDVIIGDPVHVMQCKENIEFGYKIGVRFRQTVGSCDIESWLLDLQIHPRGEFLRDCWYLFNSQWQKSRNMTVRFYYAHNKVYRYYDRGLYVACVITHLLTGIENGRFSNRVNFYSCITCSDQHVDEKVLYEKRLP